MEQQKLQELLETLHHELEQVDSVDEKTGEVLSSLRQDIRKLVADGGEDTGGQENLIERMNDAIDHFGEDHPKLSIMIQHVLDSLARMGL
jgi:archaellum component FlaC